MSCPAGGQLSPSLCCGLSAPSMHQQSKYRTEVRMQECSLRFMIFFPSLETLGHHRGNFHGGGKSKMAFPPLFFLCWLTLPGSPAPEEEPQFPRQCLVQEVQHGVKGLSWADPFCRLRAQEIAWKGLGPSSVSFPSWMEWLL